MYFIIFSLPVATIFAALQVFLCKKYERKSIRLVPLFITFGITASLGLLLIDSVSSAIAYYIDWGVFALVVYLALGAIGSATGTVAGWIIFKIICRKKAKN